jgi:hypothetical protein
VLIAHRLAKHVLKNVPSMMTSIVRNALKHVANVLKNAGKWLPEVIFNNKM